MKSSFLTLSALVLFLILPGCELPELQDNGTHQEPLLNYYNTYRDDFRGDLITGETYKYRCQDISRGLCFTASQVWDEHRALFLRKARRGVAEVSFLILSERGYVDDASLREGEYVCCGTYKDRTKTIYVLAEKAFFEANKDLCVKQKGEEEEGEENNSLLNYYRSDIDKSGGRLVPGDTYKYLEHEVEGEFRFYAIQVLGEDRVLFQRSYWETVILIISGDSYATGSYLREGKYVCCGTYTYETRYLQDKTVYVLAEKDFYKKNKERIQEFVK